MKKLIRPNIDYTKCNAYSAISHMYAAIGVKGSPIFATSVEGGIDWEIPDNLKGGIIIFSQEVNATSMSKNRLISWIKQKMATLKNKASGSKELDKIAQKYELAGWTVGNFFKGKYTGKNGQVYSEDSISVEIVGVSEDTLIAIAEELCRTFHQEVVMVKSYSERNRILFVNGD